MRLHHGKTRRGEKMGDAASESKIYLLSVRADSVQYGGPESQLFHIEGCSCPEGLFVPRCSSFSSILRILLFIMYVELSVDPPHTLPKAMNDLSYGREEEWPRLCRYPTPYIDRPWHKNPFIDGHNTEEDSVSRQIRSYGSCGSYRPFAWRGGLVFLQDTKWLIQW